MEHLSKPATKLTSQNQVLLHLLISPIILLPNPVPSQNLELEGRRERSLTWRRRRRLGRLSGSAALVEERVWDSGEWRVGEGGLGAGAAEVEETDRCSGGTIGRDGEEAKRER
jgi:hypothetical protein